MWTSLIYQKWCLLVASSYEKNAACNLQNAHGILCHFGVNLCPSISSLSKYYSESQQTLEKAIKYSGPNSQISFNPLMLRIKIIHSTRHIEFLLHIRCALCITTAVQSQNKCANVTSMGELISN